MSVSDTAHLFAELAIRDITFRNRIAVSPMCQYSSTDGFATDWHMVHLGSRAVGGAGLVIAEASAVEPRGRITPGDLGIWKEEHIAPLARLAAFIRAEGAVPGIQIAHAGRKASTTAPWQGGKAIPPDRGGWVTVAPSPIPFDPADPTPAELSASGIHGIVDAFAAAAGRAQRAGFDVVEIHAAHGYLLHQFLSPVANHRTDEYGGSFENRTRFLIEVCEAVRAAWPGGLPLFIRISATDWVDGGWDPGQSVRLAAQLCQLGVDLIDCSSGGMVPHVSIPLGPGYQTPFAERIRRETGMPTAAVGLITEPQQADEIIRTGQADMILLARAILRDPYWAIHAAMALGLEPEVPVQYARAFQKFRRRER